MRKFRRMSFETHGKANNPSWRNAHTISSLTRRPLPPYIFRSPPRSERSFVRDSETREETRTRLHICNNWFARSYNHGRITRLIIKKTDDYFDYGDVVGTNGDFLILPNRFACEFNRIDTFFCCFVGRFWLAHDTHTPDEHHKKKENSLVTKINNLKHRRMLLTTTAN